MKKQKKQKVDVKKFHALDGKSNGVSEFLYNEDLSLMTERQRSDVHNAAGAYIARLRKFRSS